MSTAWSPFTSPPGAAPPPGREPIPPMACQTNAPTKKTTKRSRKAERLMASPFEETLVHPGCAGGERRSLDTAFLCGVEDHSGKPREVAAVRLPSGVEWWVA